MKIIDIREHSAFSKILKTDSNIILDFYANWCGPCKVLLKTFESIRADSTFDDLTIVKINVDNYPDIAKTYNVRSMPTMVFTSDNSGDRKTLKTKVGNLPKNDLVELIRNVYNG